MLIASHINYHGNILISLHSSALWEMLELFREEPRECEKDGEMLGERESEKWRKKNKKIIPRVETKGKYGITQPISKV